MRSTRTRAALIAAAGLLGAAALTAYLAWPSVASAALLMDLSGAMPSVRRLLPVRVAPVQFEDVRVPTRHGAIAARRYHTGSGATRTVIVVPGVHAGGVDEPRLDALARRLAASGAIVLSVPLPDLRAYRVTVASTDMIEDAALWTIQQPATAHGRVGLIGVSFSGGLAIVACRARCGISVRG
jgi:hypothetical protein